MVHTATPQILAMALTMLSHLTFEKDPPVPCPLGQGEPGNSLWPLFSYSFALSQKVSPDYISTSDMAELNLRIG